VNVSKLISFAPRIVNVWIARTTKGVRSYGVQFKGIIHVIEIIFNKQLMLL
jgi:hypothetical protein